MVVMTLTHAHTITGAGLQGSLETPGCQEPLITPSCFSPKPSLRQIKEDAINYSDTLDPDTDQDKN